MDFRNSNSCDLGQNEVVDRQEKHCLVTRDSPFISHEVCNFQWSEPSHSLTYPENNCQMEMLEATSYFISSLMSTDSAT